MDAVTRNRLHKIGAVARLAALGIDPADASNVGPIGELLSIDAATVKEAEGSLESSLDAGLKSMAVVSAVAGIPLGVLWHSVSNSAKQHNAEADTLRAQANIYRNAAGDFEKSLARNIRSAKGVKNYADNSRNPYRLS